MQNQVFRQSFFTLLIRSIGVVLLFGFTVFLTQKFEPKIVGQYDFARTFLFTLGSISLLGFDQSVLYFKGRLNANNSMQKLKKVYLKMLLMFLGATLFLLTVMLVLEPKIMATFFADSTVYPLLLKTTAGLFFYGLTILNVEVFRALDKIIICELFRNIFKYLPLFVLAVLLIQCHLESYLVEAFLFSFVFLGVLTSGFIWFFFRENSSLSTHDGFSSKEIIAHSFPVAVSSLAFFMMLSIDVFLLKKYHDDALVAYYSVAIKLMTLLSMVIITVNVTVSVKISEYFFQNKKAELIKMVQNASRWIVLISFPITVLFCCFWQPILNIFGKEYNAAKEALLILIIGQFFCSLFGVTSVYLNMTGRQKIFQRILLTAVLINFILNQILIPQYGMTGAAISFVTSSIFWNCITAFVIYYKDKIIVFLN